MCMCVYVCVCVYVCLCVCFYVCLCFCLYVCVYVCVYVCAVCVCVCVCICVRKKLRKTWMKQKQNHRAEPKTHLIFKKPQQYRAFSILQPSKMAFFSNTRLQKYVQIDPKVMEICSLVDKAKCDVVSEPVTSIIMEKLSF